MNKKNRLYQLFVWFVCIHFTWFIDHCVPWISCTLHHLVVGNWNEFYSWKLLNYLFFLKKKQDYIGIYCCWSIYFGYITWRWRRQRFVFIILISKIQNNVLFFFLQFYNFLFIFAAQLWRKINYGMLIPGVIITIITIVIASLA